MLRLFTELRRRRVFRVTAAYAAAAFVLVQAADLYIPAIGLPEWWFRAVALATLAGLPLVVALAWVFEITPSGIRRTAPAGPGEDVAAPPRALLELTVVVGVIVAAFGGVVALVVRGETTTVLPVSDVAHVTWEGGAESSPALSPDGAWIAYEAAGDVYLRPLGGSVPINLTPDSPAFDGQPAFSPDGMRIAFASRREGGTTAGGIWVIDVSGGPARRLSESGFDPAWSPDGSEVLYTTEHVDWTGAGRVRAGRVFAVHVATGGTRLVREEDAVEPAWSPTGRRIAYVDAFQPDRPAGCQGLWTARPDGTGAVRITADACRWSGPQWSPDGRYLFAIRAAGDRGELWRFRVDEGTGMQIGEPVHVPLAARTVTAIALAGDPPTIVYEAPDLESNVQRIAFDPAGERVVGGPVPVTTGTRLWEDVDVSPQGRLVMWQRPGGLFTSDGDGGGMLELVPEPVGDRFPHWSPDGGSIAFTSYRTRASMEAWIVGSDGSGLRQLTWFEGGGAGFFPLWSPERGTILVTTGTQFGGTSYLVEPDGAWDGPPRDSIPRAPGPVELRYRPWSWSPDGRRVAAYSERGAGLAVFSFDTGEWRLLGPGEKPRWLGDSRRIVYTAAGRLLLMDTETGRTRELLALEGAQIRDPAVAPGDSTLYFIRGREEGDLWSARMARR